MEASFNCAKVMCSISRRGTIVGSWEMTVTRRSTSWVRVTTSRSIALGKKTSGQWDEGTRAVSGSWHTGYGTISTTARMFAGLWVGHWRPGHRG